MAVGLANVAGIGLNQRKKENSRQIYCFLKVNPIPETSEDQRLEPERAQKETNKLEVVYAVEDYLLLHLESYNPVQPELYGNYFIRIETEDGQYTSRTVWNSKAAVINECILHPLNKDLPAIRTKNKQQVQLSVYDRQNSNHFIGSGILLLTSRLQPQVEL